MAADDSTGSTRRRGLAVLVALLLLLLFAGIFSFPGPGDDDEDAVVELTPATATPTPTPTPGGGGAGPTQSGDVPSTDQPGDGRPTPSETAATPTATPSTPSPGDGGPPSNGGGGGDGGDDDEQPSVRLELVDAGARINYAGVTPGQSGQDELVVRNAGDDAGRLYVSDVAVRDHENGVVGPEAAVDATPDEGELSEHLEIVLELHYPDGSAEALYGTGAAPRTLAAIGNETDAAGGGTLAAGREATLSVEWHVPRSTGNVIQTDTAEFDIAVALRAEAPESS